MANIYIPGLTIDSNPNNLKAGQTIQFGSGTPLPITNTPPKATQPSAPIQSGGNSGGGTTNSHINPATGQWDDNYYARSHSLLEPLPQAPSFDETPFNDLIGQIDQLGSVFKNQYGTATQGIQDRSQAQLTDLENQKAEGEQNLQQYKTQAEQDTEGNINEQRRMQSEIQQGLQARYGGTTGTGAFVSQQAGDQTLRNVAQYRQTLQNEYSKVANMQNSLLRTYIGEQTKIKSQTEQLLSEAKDTLNKNLADLQIQKGQTNIAKSQQKSAEIQNYQNTVREINARNTNYLQNLDAQRQQIQNSLQAKTYEMTYQEHQRLLGYYEEAAKAGILSPSGLREAEQNLGLGGGSLQLPASKKNQDSNGDGIPDDQENNSSLANGTY